MSFYSLKSKKQELLHQPVLDVHTTKLVKEQDTVNGVLVDKYKFVDVDSSKDDRQNVRYQDLCLANLQALGVISQLKPLMMQRDDVDLVIDSLPSPNPAPQNE